MTSIPQERIVYGTIYRVARKNAAQRSIPFTLTRPEFDALVEHADGRCMISGVLFSPARVSGSTRRPYMPSLDRVDSSKGYSFDNVRLVCVLVNIALNEWGIEPLLHIARGIIEHGGMAATPNKARKPAHEETYMTAAEYVHKRHSVTTSSIHPLEFERTMRAYCAKRSIRCNRIIERSQSVKTYRIGLRFRNVYPVALLQRVYDRLVSHPYSYRQ